MDRAGVIETLQRHAPDIRQFGGSALYLFGSTARVALQDRLSDLLRARADVTRRGSLHPRLRVAIERSAIQVF